MRLRFSLVALWLCLVPCVGQADSGRALAVTDPQALRALEMRLNGGLGLARMLDPARAAPIANDALFALPAMIPVRVALDAEFARYLDRHAASHPRETVGVGPGHDVQLFDRAMLTSPDTRFVLAGVVNRMDRAFVAPETCGEIRLIYRLTRISGEGDTPPRLPMTLNLVLRAKEAGDATLTCREIAQRWLAAMELADTGAQLADRLLLPGGALASLGPVGIDRIETNLQIAHVPKSDLHEFRTDYLQKVFRADAVTRLFREAPMENQIDRDGLRADPARAHAFKAWLLAPTNLAALDRGTVIIPDAYLATSSLAATPVGFAPSALQPTFGVLQSEATGDGVFTEADVVTALKSATANGVALHTIRSPAGFARRLNDITCGGCHQIRGIGGFHFPGADTLTGAPSQAAVAASPHFLGDQPRRRDIVMAMRDAKTPDYSRGFADRPQSRGSNRLAGTPLLDGWGATCYRRGIAKSVDRSFASWSCAEGLVCQQADGVTASDIGMCFVK